jgi:RNA-binding protein 25
LISWRRSKGTTFGYAEFENLESVLKCMRLINGMLLNQKDLQVKGGEKAQMMIDGWLNKKETEWEERRAKLDERDKSREDSRALLKYTSF